MAEDINQTPGGVIFQFIALIMIRNRFWEIVEQKHAPSIMHRHFPLARVSKMHSKLSFHPFRKFDFFWCTSRPFMRSIYHTLEVAVFINRFMDMRSENIIKRCVIPFTLGNQSFDMQNVNFWTSAVLGLLGNQSLWLDVEFLSCKSYWHRWVRQRCNERATMRNYSAWLDNTETWLKLWETSRLMESQLIPEHFAVNDKTAEHNHLELSSHYRFIAGIESTFRACTRCVERNPKKKIPVSTWLLVKCFGSQRDKSWTSDRHTTRQLDVLGRLLTV